MSHTKKSLSILLAIFLLGSVLRLWLLGKVPEGFYSDEALYGYEAYSLLKTGKDQFGNPWPISIAGFGDYRPALYIYATMPFIAVFGLTEFAVRLPSALFSIATIAVLYLFAFEISKNKKIALFSALVLAIMPQGIYFARMAHETNLMTLLIVGGVYFLWRTKKNSSLLIISAIFFATSFYVYHTARVFVPLFIFIVSIIQRKFIKNNIKITIISLMTGLIICLPLFIELTTSDPWSRISSIGIWNDQGVIQKINVSRGELLNKGVSPQLSRLIYNKATVLPVIFINNWISHFSPNFLLLKGDPNGVYNTPRMGIFLWIESILFVIGSVILIIKRRKLGLWIILVIALSLVADSLTRVAPSSARIHLWLPFVSIIIGYGWYFLSKKNKFLYWLAALLLIINSILFWQNYLVVRPVTNSSAWRIGLGTMNQRIPAYLGKFDRIWVSRRISNWIYFLFYTRYDPAKFQNEVRIVERDEQQFWWVSDVGGVYFNWLPTSFASSQKRLYIGMAEEFPKNTVPLEKITNQLNDDQIWFVEGVQNNFP